MKSEEDEFNPFEELNKDKAVSKKDENKEISNAESKDLSDLVSDGMWLGIMQDTMDEINDNKKIIDDMIPQFLNMVINEGEASSATKEALINLVKLRCDIPDKKSKVADLMTRVKLKEKGTFPAYMAKHANNEKQGLSVTDQKKMIKELNAAVQKQKKTSGDN